MILSLTYDDSLLSAQIEDLSSLVGSDDLVRCVDKLKPNIVLGERRSTVSTDGVQRLVLFPRFDSSFDRTRAALLAGEVPCFLHEILPNHVDSCE
jgi:hypothetical protein